MSFFPLNTHSLTQTHTHKHKIAITATLSISANALQGKHCKYYSQMAVKPNEGKKVKLDNCLIPTKTKHSSAFLFYLKLRRVHYAKCILSRVWCKILLKVITLNFYDYLEKLGQGGHIVAWLQKPIVSGFGVQGCGTWKDRPSSSKYFVSLPKLFLPKLFAAPWNFKVSNFIAKHSFILLSWSFTFEFFDNLIGLLSTIWDGRMLLIENLCLKWTQKSPTRNGIQFNLWPKILNIFKAG